MKRRNFLVGAGAASIGGSALLGSGAFSRVESDRAVTIAVAEDSDAYLGLDKCDTPNGSYVHDDGKGHIQILMNDENPTHDGTKDDTLGAGVNSNSTSIFHRVFKICNQGKEPACVWISDDDDWPRVDDEEPNDGMREVELPNGGDRRVEFYREDDTEDSVIGEENAIALSVGDCICIGIKVRTHGLSDGDELLGALDNTIQINADVDGECFDTPECADLSVEYTCSVFDPPGDPDGTPIGTRYTVSNYGDGGTTFGWAVNNSPDEADEASIGGAVNGAAEAIFTGDASEPIEGVVWWNDDCTDGDWEDGAEAILENNDEIGVEDIDDDADVVVIDGIPDEFPPDWEDDLPDGVVICDVD